MKAVVIAQVDQGTTISYGQVADPSAGLGEVVVALHAIDTNFADLLYVRGTYQTMPSMPFSPGMAGAGTIMEAGEGVDASWIGQRVLVLPSHGCFAEKIAVPVKQCFPLSDGMSFDTAAAVGLAYQTAWFALFERGGFQPGCNVLVLGASGGVGMASIELARAFGAGSVFAATRAKRGEEFVKALGADRIIDAQRDDLNEAMRAEVLEFTNGRGVDIVIDPVGGVVSAAALRSLAWNGRLVSIGFASGEIPKFSAGYLLVKNLSVLGMQWTDYRDRFPDQVAHAQREIFALVAQKKLVPRISRLPLQQYEQALDLLKSGDAQGKIILETDLAKRVIA